MTFSDSELSEKSGRGLKAFQPSNVSDTQPVVLIDA